MFIRTKLAVAHGRWWPSALHHCAYQVTHSQTSHEQHKHTFKTPTLAQPTTTQVHHIQDYSFTTTAMTKPTHPVPYSDVKQHHSPSTFSSLAHQFLPSWPSSLHLSSSLSLHPLALPLTLATSHSNFKQWANHNHNNVIFNLGQNHPTGFISYPLFFIHKTYFFCPLFFLNDLTPY
jgi:hypothetical protein